MVGFICVVIKHPSEGAFEPWNSILLCNLNSLWHDFGHDKVFFIKQLIVMTGHGMFLAVSTPRCVEVFKELEVSAPCSWCLC